MKAIGYIRVSIEEQAQECNKIQTENKQAGGAQMRIVIEVSEDFHTELKLEALKQKKTFTELVLPWVEKGYNELQQIKNTAKKRGEK